MTWTLNWDDSTNKDYLKGTLWEIFDNTARKALVEYPSVMKDLKRKDYYDRDSRMAGPTGVQSLTDGQDIPLTDPTKGDEKEWTQTRHGLGFKITDGMKRYNRYDLMAKATRKLSTAMREYKDTTVARLWNNATATTYASGYDGLALASNAHTCLAAGHTYDNYLDAALGVSSLQSAIIYFAKLVDDNGDKMPKKPKKLVVNSDLVFDAAELLGSAKEPYTADNQINAIQKYGISSFEYHRLTSATSWFLLGDTGDDEFGAFVATTQEPDLQVQDAPPPSRSTLVTSQQWFAYGLKDPRLIYVGDT